MAFITDLAAAFINQLQQPTLSFLIGGMVLAALGSKLEVPAPIYRFIVMLLLLKVGLNAGMAIREADLMALAVPAVLASATGVAIVLIGSRTLARLRGVNRVDALATAGLFGAVSASTLAAGMAVLDSEGVAYEGFIGAMYPFMDIAALLTAIVMARVSVARTAIVTTDPTPGGEAVMAQTRPEIEGVAKVPFRPIIAETLASPAISALLLGLGLGVLAKPDAVYASFYEPLFRGLLSILMLIMGMEAWARLAELRKVAHAYVLYGVAAPLVHGLLGLGAGLIAHHLTGFSQGGVVLLAVMAASSSDLSGPPTLRGALPDANPSAFIGTSTGLGTPVAILSIPLFMALSGVLMAV